ncbi:MAG: ferrous iron transport protein B [Firmicutes bacterium]|nr:ferrous iron transport protein B [Bacillota bacterium]
MLRPGQSGLITEVSNRDPAVRRRLIDMGLTPGTKVTIKKIAPFGDPLEVSVRNYALSLRGADAMQIRIGEPPRRPRRPNCADCAGCGQACYVRRQFDEATLDRMRHAHDHELDYHAGKYDRTEHDRREMRIALVGNPNSGKTTLFNALTGANQYVGNWPGVTVEKKEGKASFGSRQVTVADLPGVYSLSPYSMEEIVTRDYLVREAPDAVINIVDATNLERNLYLTVQLLELEKPMVMALNFMDEVEKRGDRIDLKRLSETLGIPIIPITAKTGQGLDELMHTAHRQMHIGYTVEPDDLYDDFTHEIHHEVGELIHDFAYAAGLPAHWAGVKVLEGDKLVEDALHLDDETKQKLRIIAAKFEAASPFGDRETLVADSRYRYIENAVKTSLLRGRAEGALSASDRIDKVVTNKYLAVPAFLLTMLLIFAITFGPIGKGLSNGVGILLNNYLGVWLGGGLSAIHAAPWLVSLAVKGILAGVGGVLTFLPQIALLFFFLSLLEDSGYMARAAFIMDRLLKRFGLSGKAFIPMLMGFGCTVPAVMGARAMESEKDRRMTVMLIPFMSCSAKLPVYGLIAAAFFGRYAGFVVFGLYLLGMALAILSGLLFKKTLFRGESAAFVLELPPYRLPSLKNTLRHVWDRVRGFLVRAGTLILMMSVILWFLRSFGPGFRMAADAEHSILGALGGLLAPIFTPLGFGAWQAAVALLTGFVAKEAVVASLSMFYGFALTASGAAVSAALSGTFGSPLAAFAFLVFVLLYVPCVAAVSAIHREMGSLKWTLTSVAWQLICAYGVSLLVYQLGRLVGLA